MFSRLSDPSRLSVSQLTVSHLTVLPPTACLLTVCLLTVCLLTVCLLTSCRETTPAQSTEPASTIEATSRAESTVLLISFDGFRADFVQRYPTPNLDRMIAEGVVADEGMIPSFPTLTFPNHFTMVTGLYPAHNGMISNTMYDPPTDSWFRISDPAANVDPMWWEGEPIWVTAEKQGRTAATYFWVGSEAPIEGIRPTYFRKFDSSVPGNDRVDQVLAWLDLPPAERPSFIALYFEDVDSVVHREGVESTATAAVVARVDAYLGRLLRGLSDRNILAITDILVVADHGMADRSPERSIVLEDYIDPASVEMINTSPVAMMNARRGTPADVVQKLQGANPHLRVYAREDVPPSLHFSGHYRIPEIIAIADEGWTIFRSRESYENNVNRIRGATHGYDPALESMRALFVASGPSFRPGMKIEPFENVNLYSLMTHIMGLKPAENDGELSIFSSILQRR